MKNERQDKILKILNEREFATVSFLADTLYSSLPTIRRDLAELARQGLIIRSHGGAAAVNDTRLAMPFDFRTGSGRDIKLRMSRAAAELIHDGDTVFIDGSTSCLHIADFLKEHASITVVTNSVLVPMKFTDYGFDIHCTGDRLLKSSLSYVGSRAVEYTRDFHFDCMFFSCATVSDSGIITDYSQQETELRRSVMTRSDKRVMLCDSSKFGKSSAFFVADAHDIDLIITDATPKFSTVLIKTV